MNFPRTVVSVCTGTSGFPSFLEVSPLRALLHLGLLSLLAAIFIATCRFIPTITDAAHVCATLSDSFGDVRCDAAKGVVPSKPLTSPLTVILSSQARLDYFPTADSVSLAEIDEWKSLCGFIWTPDMVTIWLRTSAKADGGLYFARSIIPKEQPAGFVEVGSIGKARLTELVKAAKWPGGKPPFDSLSFKDLPLVVGILSTGLLFGMSLVGILVFTIMVIGFFAAVQYVWVSGLFPKLRFGNIITISVYSAFPAIMVASLVPAFDLPFLSFHLVFFLCFFIYHMVAFNAVQKSLMPPDQRKPSSWDDDDGF